MKIIGTKEGKKKHLWAKNFEAVPVPPTRSQSVPVPPNITKSVSVPIRAVPVPQCPKCPDCYDFSYLSLNSCIDSVGTLMND